MKKSVKIIILCLALAFTGCSTNYDKNLSDNNVTYKVVNENYIKGEVCENVTMDMSVDTVPSDIKIGIYNVALSDIPQNANQIFTINSEKDELLIDTNSLYYQTENAYYIKRLIFPLCAKVNSVYDFTVLDGSGGELTFKSSSDVRNSINKTFDDLGIEIDKNYDMYALNYKYLQNLNKKMTNNGNIAPQKDGTLLIKEEWTESDDVYFAKINGLLGGIRLYDGTTGSVEAGNFKFGTEIFVLYSKKGIEYCEIRYPYHTTKTIEENVKVIAIDDAIKSMQKYFDEMLVDSPISINRAEFSMVTLQTKGNSEYIAKPAWIFHMEQRMNEVSIPMSIIIDAVTGKVIV